MKLYITNKVLLDSSFENPKKVHVDAYHRVMVLMETEQVIPLTLMQINEDKTVSFNLKSYNNDICFYEIELL